MKLSVKSRYALEAMLTIAHMTRRPPILGVGVGELLNIAPYGLDYSHRTTRLEEALHVIRRNKFVHIEADDILFATIVNPS